MDYLTYEDFGAKGDGVTDDMPAIVACHNYANRHRLEVAARDGAKYYIGGKALTAEIKTNTHFGKAEFIIDDRDLENIRQSCFHVCSDASRFVPEIKTLSKNAKKVEFPHEGNVYVRVFSDRKMVYIRKGLNQNNGTPASDCFLADAQGNVTGGINWDYKTVTSAYAFSTDDAPIVIEGGIFTTIANCRESKYNYHARNIHITRSHVTLRDLTHNVEGEGDHGAPYSAFLSVEECCDVTLRDCLLTPHKTYYTESKLPGKMVGMGTYDLSATAAINVHFINIRQTRDIKDTTYWGLMGSNFCKELHLEHCVISRFDAHCGVTNGSIRNCVLGHMGVNLIGFGEFLIENTEVYSDHFLAFRSDYGSFFHGTLTLRRCTWHLIRNGKGVQYVFHAKNAGDHDFGYVCGMPGTITLDGLTIDDEHAAEDVLSYAILPDYDPSFAPGRPYPYGTPSHVTAHVVSLAGKEIRLCEKPEQYPDLEKNAVEL